MDVHNERISNLAMNKSNLFVMMNKDICNERVAGLKNYIEDVR